MGKHRSQAQFCGSTKCPRYWSWTFRFHFFSREVWLQPVQLDFSEGFNPSEIRRIRELTFEHQAEFLGRWNEYFAR